MKYKWLILSVILGVVIYKSVKAVEKFDKETEELFI
jgi:hypothetical protein